jgi:hypothetical protein
MTVRSKAETLMRSPLGVLATVRATDEAASGSLTEERLYELVIGCVVDLTVHAPDYPERARALMRLAPSLRRKAHQLLAMPSAASWYRDLDRADQVWISPGEYPPPGPGDFHPDLRPFRAEPKPLRSLWTSSTIGHYPSGWIPYLLTGEDGRSPPYQPWRLTVTRTARVYEICGPLDWHALCTAYPAYQHNRLLEPDWHAVARDWDGVHLTVGGLLAAEGVPFGGPGHWSKLSGWNSESTVWLRWAFDGAERLPPWRL